MRRGYELGESKTEIKPIGTPMSFFLNFFLMMMMIIIYYFILFSSGGFSKTGCYIVTSKSNSEGTVCSCNHLTHFAVLLDYNGSPGVMSLFSLTFSIGNRISLD